MSVITSILWLMALAAALAVTRGADDGFLHLPFSRQSQSEREPLAYGNYKRQTNDGSIDVQIQNNKSLYYVDFALGTPPQNIKLAINTTSSDFWVVDPNACYFCDSGPSTFIANDSSTFKSNQTRFTMDIDAITGTMAQDVLRFGDIEIDNFNFGVANVSNSVGTAGLGLPKGEAAYEVTIDQPYANLPQQLKNQGVIHHAAYSMWLDSKESETGSILFGAIDHSKLKSDLYVLPLIINGVDEDEDVDEDAEIYGFDVLLTGLSAYDSEGNEQPFAACAIPAKFDSGSAVSYFPTEVLEPFFNAIGADYDSSWTVPCGKWNSSEVGIGIQLGGVDVTVSLKDLLVPGGNPYGYEQQEQCFTFLNSGYTATIGNNILQSLYVVYDLENLEIGIAAAETGNGANETSSIEVLSTGIPGSRVSHDTRQASEEYQVTPITAFGTQKMLSISTSEQLTTYTHQATVTLRSSVTEAIVIGAKPGLQKPPSSVGNSTSVAVSSNSTSSSGVAGNVTSKASESGSRIGAGSGNSVTTQVQTDNAAANTGNSVVATSTTSKANSAGDVQQRSSTASSDAAVIATGSILAFICSAILSLL